MYVMGAMARLAAATDLPYVVAMKLPSILADAALTGLIYRTVADRHRSDGRGREWAAYLALLYALNPVSLLVSSYHGQFEAVTLLLSVFAVTVGFGIQWLVWLVPFGLLVGQDRRLRLYSLAAALMLTIHLYGLHMVPWLADWFPACLLYTSRCV